MGVPKRNITLRNEVGFVLDLAFVFSHVEHVERVVAHGVRALTRRFSAVPCGSVEGGGHGVVYAFAGAIRAIGSRTYRRPFASAMRWRSATASAKR